MEFPVRFGKYDLLERIAMGGMAEVFLARSFGVEGFEKKLVINSFEAISLRYREMVGPKGEPLKQHLYFCRKHGGFLWPLWFVARYLKPLIQFVRWWVRKEPVDW